MATSAVKHDATRFAAQPSDDAGLFTFRSEAYWRIKLVLDWITAAILCALLLPLFALIAALVRIDSSGPALFRQKRVGFGGRPFVMYKFRTMRQGSACNERHSAITLPDDARVTRVGRLLRRTRLDELPQIFNILRGEMSWIGPRPEALPLSVWYEAEIPFYRQRHVVRPGITGWAQVKQGHVVDVDEVRAKLQYDLYYIRHFSWWMDLVILARTVPIVLGGFGAK